MAPNALRLSLEAEYCRASFATAMPRSTSGWTATASIPKSDRT
jgi:hypothetical protein